MKFFSDINEKNIREFDEYLHTVTWKEHDRFGNEVTRKYSQATIESIHKNLKVFISDAVVDGLLSENPYSTKRIKIDKGGTRIDHFLTKEEIESFCRSGLLIGDTNNTFCMNNVVYQTCPSIISGPQVVVGKA
jgi:hypothetical protein